MLKPINKSIIINTCFQAYAIDSEVPLIDYVNISIRSNNSTLRYECDETFSDECEFAARAEGE